MNGIIPWAEVPDWIKRRNQVECKHSPFSILWLWVSCDRPLLPWPSRHDGLQPWTVRQNKLFLLSVVFVRVSCHQQKKEDRELKASLGCGRRCLVKQTKYYSSIPHVCYHYPIKYLWIYGHIILNWQFLGSPTLQIIVFATLSVLLSLLKKKNALSFFFLSLILKRRKSIQCSCNKWILETTADVGYRKQRPALLWISSWQVTDSGRQEPVTATSHQKHKADSPRGNTPPSHW